jgi:hypothetical protein
MLCYSRTQPTYRELRALVPPDFAVCSLLICAASIPNGVRWAARNGDGFAFARVTRSMQARQRSETRRRSRLQRVGATPVSDPGCESTHFRQGSVDVPQHLDASGVTASMTISNFGRLRPQNTSHAINPSTPPARTDAPHSRVTPMIRPMNSNIVHADYLLAAIICAACCKLVSVTVAPLSIRATSCVLCR